MRVRLPKHPAKGGADSFTAFFHPKQVATSSEAAEPPTQGTTVNMPGKSALAATPTAALAASDSTKLDVNLATATELMQIPGVGPVLSQRIMEARDRSTARTTCAALVESARKNSRSCDLSLLSDRHFWVAQCRWQKRDRERPRRSKAHP